MLLRELMKALSEYPDDMDVLIDTGRRVGGSEPSELLTPPKHCVMYALPVANPEEVNADFVTCPSESGDPVLMLYAERRR